MFHPTADAFAFPAWQSEVLRLTRLDEPEEMEAVIHDSGMELSPQEAFERGMSCQAYADLFIDEWEAMEQRTRDLSRALTWGCRA